ncbi:FAD-dependent oxidoreductase [Arcobacter sp. FWKO B]|uniref:FAD-dependent oxidoreductase n=1 Tax=Arcobacter sp. FWKO B TaxID=2593672 RepID=UPI0018A52328|nr:FAD-dependent oxidoreductase [Arcobacter sp. FWKO B]QOG11352.1 FAD-dependent oxidoreductase [Arcobacter sp. FWKO B]
MKSYEYIIIGAGIAGCSVAHFLSKSSSSVLLIDRNDKVASEASGAAGAFLSPLLGKPNDFKDLVTKSLKFSTNFYKKNFPDSIINNGVLRIPKDDLDKEKFQHYEHDFNFSHKDDGYFFPIGSLVSSSEICLKLSTNVEKLFNFNVKMIQYRSDLWVLNDTLKCKNLILCTGADTQFLPKYIDIRAVWGQRIVCKSSLLLSHNFHKECSISLSLKNTFDNDKKKPYLISIGATHHRITEKKLSCTEDIGQKKSISFVGCNNCETGCIEDTKKLLLLANDIIKLDDLEVVKTYAGARASSIDYFPIVGDIVDETKTLDDFPYLKSGTHVKEERFTRFNNLYILNGVGGRGFVLSPYLASNLVDFILNKQDLPQNIKTDRLFKRWVKK